MYVLSILENNFSSIAQALFFNTKTGLTIETDNFVSMLISAIDSELGEDKDCSIKGLVEWRIESLVKGSTGRTSAVPTTQIFKFTAQCRERLATKIRSLA